MFEINYGPKINYQLCNGCGGCYEYCPMDIFGWNAKKQKPLVAHPAECRVCCICETVCPEVAIDVSIPLHVKIDFGIYP